MTGGSSTYLITGGAGFIGSNLAHALAASGERVRLFDDFSTGRGENLASLPPSVEVIEGDLRDGAAVSRACEGVDYVLHQGAIPSVPRSFIDPVAVTQVNVLGTLHVLEGARRNGVRRVVYASSSAVYGDQPAAVKDESLPTCPISPYGASKLAGEHLALAYHRGHGLETVALRYFNVFGPRQNPNSTYAAVIPRFVTALLEGKPPEVHGDGGKSREFTYIDNVVAGNRLACSAAGAAGQAVNLACGGSFTLLDILAKLGRLVEREVAPRFSPPRIGDIRTSRADIARARQILGYEPVVSLDEGLRRTVEWYRSVPVSP